MDTKNSFASEKKAHYALSAAIVVLTVIGGGVLLVTDLYAQMFTTKIAFLLAGFVILFVEGAMFGFSLMPLKEADQNAQDNELKLIALLRMAVDSKAFDYYLKSLAKNPSSDELLAGFDQQITLARACLEMILPSANRSTHALLTGIVTDKINRVVPARGFEEKWREVVRNAQERLEIKTTT